MKEISVLANRTKKLPMVGFSTVYLNIIDSICTT